MFGFSTFVGVLSLSCLAFSESQKCYKEIGCFSNDGPWKSGTRSSFPLPRSPEDIIPEFISYNRNNKAGSVVYEGGEFQVEGSGFSASRRKTYFIINGFLQLGSASWLLRMKDSLLVKEDVNIFSIDFGKGAEDILYVQAASDCRTAAAVTVRLLRLLELKFGLVLSGVHLIGHSLGAHIASYTAKSVRGIGRVTGLDCAQPGFEGFPKETRIDKTDATFVDCIHTNAKPFIPDRGHGMYSAVCDVDIYVNGGLEQPGCKSPDEVNNFDLATITVGVFINFGACSHRRSIDYFEASINSKCKRWARKILNFGQSFRFSGLLRAIFSPISECSLNTCTEMSLDADKYESRGVFAASITDRYPYCGI